ncbi:MAG: hypothetical protein II882_06840 [Lachnospiraceae bacterium]|nr:hypothetical protein [Lachnospiraceae bacterium]
MGRTVQKTAQKHKKKQRIRKEDLKNAVVGMSTEKQAFWLWIAALVLLAAAVALAAVSCGRQLRETEDISPSTRTRTKLDKGAVSETGYYQDDLGLIKSRSVLEKGMKYFYDKTGVQPYLYLTDTLGASEIMSEARMAASVQSIYDDRFTDEGHALLLFYRNAGDTEPYRVCCVSGTAAGTVMDSEARDILLDYIRVFYYNTDSYPGGPDEQFFSDAFTRTARDIMSVRSRTGWIGALVIVSAAMLAVAALEYRKALREKKARETKNNVHSDRVSVLP